LSKILLQVLSQSLSASLVDHAVQKAPLIQSDRNEVVQLSNTKIQCADTISTMVPDIYLSYYATSRVSRVHEFLARPAA